MDDGTEITLQEAERKRSGSFQAQRLVLTVGPLLEQL
jgi:hypothetical protein